MRRLSRRSRDERGAVAVVVAISMVVLMGFVAISVDVGSMYSDEQQLQNGADAAALAIAQNCLRATCTDSANQAVADKYAKANKMDGQVKQTVVTNAAGSVTVKVDSTHQNSFAQVFGINTTELSAHATASYGYASGGLALPLTFGWCEFLNATGNWDGTGAPPSSTTPVTFLFKGKVCTNSAHNEVPGGFGWLDTGNSTSCDATVLAGWVDSSPGMKMPKACDGFWTGKQGKTVLLPIFGEYKGQGANAQYNIKGLAAFTITAYCFVGATWNWSGCNASNNGIQGYFTSYTDVSGTLIFDPPGTPFGVKGV